MGSMSYTPTTIEKPKRKWQNLLFQKCPNCDTRLEPAGKFLMCPNPHPSGDANRNCFFIAKTKAIECILDAHHPANYCLSAYQREHLNEALQESGLMA